jgi:hypothetical protein
MANSTHATAPIGNASNIRHGILRDRLNIRHPVAAIASQIAGFKFSPAQIIRFSHPKLDRSTITDPRDTAQQLQAQ